MGLIISKWVSANKNLKENLTKFKESNIDLHEEPNNIFQTPKMKKKSDSTGNNTINRQQQSKSLKNLKLDPRSPTVGIYRTPILIEESANNDVKFCNFDSPISIYSSNVTNCSLQDIMTPLEPPVNVSGFEEKKDNEESYKLLFDNSIPLPHSNSEKIGSLKVKHIPTTFEAKKLLEEIKNDENSTNKNHTSTKKNCKMLSKSNKEKPFKEIKSNLLKNRTPLSNITSSGNSPSYLATSSGKLFSRSKATAEFGSENSSSPLGQQLARWDTNNTVII